MSDGAIMELLSRGKKDAYQNQDPVRSWFDSAYQPRSPATAEYRVVQTDNAPRFGQWFDITIPSEGDILTGVDVRITLPTWLPPDILSRCSINDVSVESKPYMVGGIEYPPCFTQYGWTDGVANFLFKKWALYIDTIKLVEGYGDFNNVYPDTNTTQLKAPLIHVSTGRNDGSPAGIAANANLPELVFRVPIPGCQGAKDSGIPLCAFKGQRIYLRFWMRDKTHLVQSGPLDVSSGSQYPVYEICPEPWGFRRIAIRGVVQSDLTIAGRLMGQPAIYARLSVLNVDNELRQSLAAAKHEIRFRQQLLDRWTIDTLIPGPYKQSIQIGGFFQTLFIGIQSGVRIKQNRLSDYLPPTGDWLTGLSVNINNQDRIYDWTPASLKVLANNTQLGRDVNTALYYLIFGVSRDDEPGGTINLRSCQKAILNMTFAAVVPDPMSDSSTTFGSVLGLSWNILDIERGVAKLRFPD
jgi:hypothetical protein